MRHLLYSRQAARLVALERSVVLMLPALEFQARVQTHESLRARAAIARRFGSDTEQESQERRVFLV